jgi:hypothetical protein
MNPQSFLEIATLGLSIPLALIKNRLIKNLTACELFVAFVLS